MATRIEHLKGTTAQNDAATEPEAVISVDTQKDELRLHDGARAGGHAIARADFQNVANPSFAHATSALAIPIGTTAQRPSITRPGMRRWNTTLGYEERAIDSAGTWEEAETGTEAVQLPANIILTRGTTAQRPSGVQTGLMRYNTTLRTPEIAGESANSWAGLVRVGDSVGHAANANHADSATAAETSLGAAGNAGWQNAVGTTSQRPSNARVGYERWNSTLNRKEIWNGTIWAEILTTGHKPPTAVLADMAINANGNAHFGLPVGTTLQRGTSFAPGDIRYNQTTGKYEGVDGSLAFKNFLLEGDVSVPDDLPTGNTVGNVLTLVSGLTPAWTAPQRSLPSGGVRNQIIYSNGNNTERWGNLPTRIANADEADTAGGATSSAGFNMSAGTGATRPATSGSLVRGATRHNTTTRHTDVVNRKNGSSLTWETYAFMSDLPAASQLPPTNGSNGNVPVRRNGLIVWEALALPSSNQLIPTTGTGFVHTANGTVSLRDVSSATADLKYTWRATNPINSAGQITVNNANLALATQILINNTDGNGGNQAAEAASWAAGTLLRIYSADINESGNGNRRAVVRVDRVVSSTGRAIVDITAANTRVGQTTPFTLNSIVYIEVVPPGTPGTNGRDGTAADNTTAVENVLQDRTFSNAVAQTGTRGIILSHIVSGDLGAEYQFVVRASAISNGTNTIEIQTSNNNATWTGRGLNDLLSARYVRIIVRVRNNTIAPVLTSSEFTVVLTTKRETFSNLNTSTLTGSAGAKVIPLRGTYNRITSMVASTTDPRYQIVESATQTPANTLRIKSVDTLTWGRVHADSTIKSLVVEGLPRMTANANGNIELS